MLTRRLVRTLGFRGGATLYSNALSFLLPEEQGDSGGGAQLRGVLSCGFNMGTKVLVDGLPPSFHDEDLRALFSPYGLVLSAQIMTAPSGRSLGAGSVRMATIEEATLAIRGLDRKKLGEDVLQVLLIANQNPN